MEITCRNCGRRIASEHLNVQTRIAVCPHCDEVFDFSESIPGKPQTERLLTPPALFTVAEQNGTIRIEFGWFTWRAPIFLAIGLLLTGVPVLMLSVLGGAEQVIHPLWLLIMLLIGIFGVGLTYYSFAQFMNRTVITVQDNTLQIQHPPIPMPGNIHLSSEAIDHIAIQEQSRQTDYGKVAVYHVVAHLRDGTQKFVIRGLQAEEEARFLEYQIMRYLKMAARPIPDNSVTA